MKRLPLRIDALLVSLTLAVTPTWAASDLDGLEVLFVTKSSGFEHSVIRRDEGKPSHAEKILESLASEHGFNLETTKDAGRVNAAELEKIDVVVFYTTGDLTASGSAEGLFGGDGEPPMSATGLGELLQWIRSGGAFVGIHSATDTFQAKDKSVVSPYVAMIGGQFRIHGAQFVGRVLNTAPEHPVMRGFPRQLEIKEEWYLFDHQFADATEGEFKILARLDPLEARNEQPKLYDVAAYPILWSRDFGEGRVVYNAMGHREDVWTREEFQTLLINSLAWAAEQ
ncbi:MAG: ThuA domain-containing protein [Acidobacteriota bacterium]